MRWLLLWVAVGLVQLGIVAACGWMLWRKGRALWRELATQGRTVGGLAATIQRLGLAADRPEDSGGVHH